MRGAVTAVTQSATLPGITNAPQLAWRSEHASKQPVSLRGVGTSPDGSCWVRA